MAAPITVTCPKCSATHSRGALDGRDTYRCLNCGITYKAGPDGKAIDPRIVNGSSCVWWGHITEASLRPITTGGSLPCCPVCACPLYETPTIDEWWAAVDAREQTQPGYRAMVEWLRGKHFQSMGDVAAAFAIERFVAGVDARAATPKEKTAAEREARAIARLRQVEMITDNPELRAWLAENEATDAKDLGHRPRVTFELVPVLWVRVRGEKDTRPDPPGIDAMPRLARDRGVGTLMLQAEIAGVLPCAIRSLGGGGGFRAQLNALEDEQAIRDFLLGLECIEESSDGG